ncbi:hypothetical protein ONE63_001063 [Megalurothrips usitatus]|uniref:Retrovirus-related Pol polyprotein from transposon TNT 1-94 n=1 Tax=Megalurothrips usitatus TaxID=439358 RepID=A0AAV7XBY3_9NEOP|nr:hypothetical protein ONE63_001063 [Megalurothrips usitatus]
MPNHNEDGDGNAGAGNGGTGLKCIVNSSYNLNDKQRLTGKENYSSWAFLMKGILVTEDLWNVVLGTEADPVKADRAFYRIVFNVDSSLHPMLFNKTNPKGAWDLLKESCEADTSNSRMELYQRLFSIRADKCANILEYLNEIVSIQERLKSQEKGMDEEVIAYIMLLGLPSHFEPLKITLSSLNQKLDMKFVRQKILNCNVMSTVDSAMVVKERPQQKTEADKKKEATCFFCKKKGHFKKDCKKFKAWKEKQQKERAALAVVNDKVQVERCMLSSVDVALLTSSTSDWYIDSGASTHMCGEEAMFSKLSNTHNRREVHVANNEILRTHGLGEVTLRGEFGPVRIKEVLFVPGIAANLLSVSGMLDKGMDVKFSKTGCIISKEGEAWLSARRKNGLFIINQGDCPRPSELRALLTVDQKVWHRRLGHLGAKSMQKIQEKLGNVTVRLNAEPCEVCLEGKMRRKPFPDSDSRSDDLLDLVHSDIMGPLKIASFGGTRYVLVFVDDHSRKIFAYVLKHKSETFETFKKFKAMVETQAGRKLKVFRTDNGTEFLSNNFKSYYESNGIVHQTTCTYTPEQNGRAERANLSIMDGSRCMLFDSGLDKRFWAESVMCTVYLRNRSPSAPLKGIIPEEIWSGKAVDLSNLRIFGSAAYVLVPRELRGKLDPRSKKMIFVGYSDVSKAWRFVDPSNLGGPIVKSRDATFLEGVQALPDKPVFSDYDIFPNFILELQMEPAAGQAHQEPAAGEPEDQHPEPANVHPEPEPRNQEPETEEQEDHEELQDPAVQERRYPMRTRRTNRRDDFVYGFHVSLNDPVTVAEALARQDAGEWRKAMQEEYDSLMRHGTWELVLAPEGRKPISSKWVFKLKKDASGVPVRYKARLVARGFDQRYGVDFNDTYSPTVSHSRIRLLFALAVRKDWKIHHVDIGGAFLEGKLDETIYMDQPECFNKNPGMVCIGVLKEALAKEFEVWELGPVSSYLGIRVRHDLKEGTISLDQSNYIEETLEAFRMQDCNPASTPLCSSQRLQTADPETEITGKPYQRLLGRLMFLAVGTRPDIMHSLSVLSQFSNHHSEEHWTALKRVLRYLKGTVNFKLTYSNHGGDLQFYSDSDWGNCIVDRRSYTGFVVLLGGAATCWESRKQRSVALSSTQAELVALTEVGKEAVRTIALLQEVTPDFKFPVSIRSDNQGAIACIAQDALSRKLRFTDIRYHFLKDLCDEGKLKIDYVSTQDMVADICTKGLPGPRHQLLCGSLGLTI